MLGSGWWIVANVVFLAAVVYWIVSIIRRRRS